MTVTLAEEHVPCLFHCLFIQICEKIQLSNLAKFIQFPPFSAAFYAQLMSWNDSLKMCNTRSKEGAWQEKRNRKRKEKSKPYFGASYSPLLEIRALLWGKSSVLTWEKNAVRSIASCPQCLYCKQSHPTTILQAVLDGSSMVVYHLPFYFKVKGTWCREPW